MVGFRVQGSGFRVQGSVLRVHGLGFRVQGLGFRVQGPGIRKDLPAGRFMAAPMRNTSDLAFNHRDDPSIPALRHGSLNSLFQVAL